MLEPLRLDEKERLLRGRRLYPRRMRIQKSLNEIGDRLAQAKADLKIVEEQLLFQMDVVEETKNRSVVSETPLADREHQEAQADYQRLQKQREMVQAEIAELQREQDKLLDRMLG